ncbi:putative cysteine proteinase CG12163 [Teleopsis dalmanni]|uniref:putative cysteine proteinase CG12163 n=1 Tax=Teleopsis dalmanni TaxID=139649 RepID=UPI0018CDCB99|nr:putative cysteine proteinase CG12163 [Teleopsis dalmanni]
MRLNILTSVTIVALLMCGQIKADDSKSAEYEQQQNDAALQPVSEEPIKLVHVLNPGEREYLSPNLIGVQNIAMTFMPLTMNFINIIDAFREIVNGVRYEILLNANDTKNNDVETICRLVILEKPWLRTEWGDKYRELQHSNCSSDADNLADSNAHTNELNDKYKTNPTFNGALRNEVSDDEMAKLEAQIMSYNSDVKRRASTTTTRRTTVTTKSVVVDSNEAVTPVEDNESETTLPPELNADEKKLLDDIFSIGALNFEQSRRNNRNDAAEAATADNNEESDYPQRTAHVEQLEEPQRYTVLPDPKPNMTFFIGEVIPFDKEHAFDILERALETFSVNNGPYYKIVKVYNATRQEAAGTITKLDVDLIDRNNFTERCKVMVWKQPWERQCYEVTFKCPSKGIEKNRHSRSIEYAQKKTHKKHDHHSLNKVEHLFNKFQLKYNRRYAHSMERQMRLRIFKQNLKTIEDLNRNEMGSAKYGITEFADMTSAEYRDRTGLWERDANKPTGNEGAAIPDIELPKEFDWRSKGVVSKVKNQGSCGSCWAFSVTGNIEGLHAVKTGKLEEYSEQELLDCDTIDSACGGGLPDNAYKAIKQIGGLETEADYPYDARKEHCHFDASKVHVKISGAVDLPKNETAMAQWLIANGPISIGINANAMQFYRGGVSHPWHPLCSRNNLDHGVLIVGYGVSDYPMFKKTLPYWIVKNSWGTKWGEQGYYRVYRGDNTCGVSEMATSAILADN